MERNLTKGSITINILLFALPLMLGNLLQQMYNIADTWVVGRFLGSKALAAVGSSYALMIFLTSIILGLCMGCSAGISMDYGSKEYSKMRQNIFMSFILIGIISVALNVLVYVFMDFILWFLQIPIEIQPLIKDYLNIIFIGIIATFLYNYFANILRAIGHNPSCIFIIICNFKCNTGFSMCVNTSLGCKGSCYCDSIFTVYFWNRNNSIHNY